MKFQPPSKRSLLVAVRVHVAWNRFSKPQRYWPPTEFASHARPPELSCLMLFWFLFHSQSYDALILSFGETCQFTRKLCAWLSSAGSTGLLKSGAYFHTAAGDPNVRAARFASS